MPAFAYDNCPYPVRPSMAQAYRASWDYVSAPGSWWTGAQRVAIAEAARIARDCALCRDRARALAPGAPGTHDGPAGPLSAKAVDAVHRITTDAARLSEAWLESMLDDAFTYGHYVEAVSVVVTVICIDTFHQVLGLPLEPLPAPRPGQPSEYWPAGAEMGTGWVPMLHPDALDEPEADLFGGGRFAPNVLRALSLVPDAVRQLVAQSAVQYVGPGNLGSATATGELSLTRPQIELVASRTSALNDCFY